MATFSIENFGCRATEADAAALCRALLADGLTPVPEHASADVVVLNTCTVTAAADSQAREAIRKIHRANPAARIVVTGCYAQRAPEELSALDGVAWVVGNSHRMEIPRLLSGSIVSNAAPTLDFVPAARLAGHLIDRAMSPSAPSAHASAKILTGDIFAERVFPSDGMVPAAGDRTRPIFKIQDGCNN